MPAVMAIKTRKYFQQFPKLFRAQNVEWCYPSFTSPKMVHTRKQDQIISFLYYGGKDARMLEAMEKIIPIMFRCDSSKIL